MHALGREHTNRGLFSAQHVVEVDSLDRAILSVLRDSGRAPFVDIAKQVGVTERTVRTRIRRLEDDGVVRGYTIREAGIGLTALVRLKVGPGTDIGSLAGALSTWCGAAITGKISSKFSVISRK